MLDVAIKSKYLLTSDRRWGIELMHHETNRKKFGQKTCRFGVMGDIPGLTASSSIKYDDRDGEPLLYDGPVSKSTTVTVTPKGK